MLQLCFIIEGMIALYSKLIGMFVGFGVTADLSGIVVGLLCGAVVDIYFLNIEKPQRSNDKWQTEFSYLFIILHAKFAKIDGQVTPAEVRAFQDIISVVDDDMDTVRFLYNMHRKSSDGFEQVAVRLSEILILRQNDRRLLMDSLCAVGMIEGELNLYQDAYIQAVGRILGYSDTDIDEIKRETNKGENYSSKRHASDKVPPDAKLWADIPALKTLGLKKTATAEEIKKAYKKSIKLYHPDKLRGKGVSEADIRKAEIKIAEINEAYAILMKKNRH